MHSSLALLVLLLAWDTWPNVTSIVLLLLASLPHPWSKLFLEWGICSFFMIVPSLKLKPSFIIAPCCSWGWRKILLVLTTGNPILLLTSSQSSLCSRWNSIIPGQGRLSLPLPQCSRLACSAIGAPWPTGFAAHSSYSKNAFSFLQKWLAIRLQGEDF